MMIADHPYIACALAFLFGLLIDRMVRIAAELRRQPAANDDDITGIGA